MKNVILVASLLLTQSAVSFSRISSAEIKQTDAINIEMNGDLLIATSNDPNDLLRKIQVFNESMQLVAQKKCTGMECSLNLSSLPSGIYIAVAYSQYNQYSENIYLD